MKHDFYQDNTNSTTHSQAEEKQGLAKALAAGKAVIKTIAPIALAGTLGGLVGEAFRRR